MIPRSEHPEILVVSAGLFGARIEHDEIVDHLKEPGLVTQLNQGTVERAGEVPGLRGLFLPTEVVFLSGLGGSVAQAFSVVARHDKLHGGEERLDEDRLLVVKVLADALGDRDR